MANVKLIFSGTKQSSTELTNLQVYANSNNELYIEINDNDVLPSCCICLDKETAIKLSKEIRKQISYLED